MEGKTVCGISVIMKTTGMCRKDILAHIGTGKIKAKKQGKLFAFDASEKTRLESLHNSYIGFFHLAQSCVSGKAGFSTEKRKCKDELIEFAAENEWFGANVLPVDDVFFANTSNEAYFVNKNDERQLVMHMRLWIAAYGESAESKLRLLLDRLQEIHPVTATLLGNFFEDEYPNDYTAAWILTDFLCSALNGEITKADDKALDSMAVSADKKLPLNSARMFSAFLTYLRGKRKLANGWVYRFGPRGEAKEKDAYPVMSYFKMAYTIFNEEAWETERLKEKALNSETYANLWAFVAFHFICGWRGSDIVRIPMPSLPCAGEIMREQLSSGNFDADGLLKEIELRLRYVPMKPSKTKSFNVPELKLFIAESLRKPLGFILSAAVSYHENVPLGGAFIRRAGNLMEIQGFFGMDFASCICQAKNAPDNIKQKSSKCTNRKSERAKLK